ncbi:MAG: sigma-70 family RNA polymerase sigma factor [Lentisphaeraceae bacterium]|nr:sigma-70 family RNA polymerase sigma factor [Lentisphaeraceae bacterium]
MRIKKDTSTDKLQEFSDLAVQSQSSVRAFIRSLGVSSDMVDDYAQETFLIAFRKFETFDPQKASFTFWVKGIARYQILNESRKLARRHRLQNEFIIDLLLSDPISIYDERGDELVALQMCVNKLDGPALIMIKQSYVENKNSKDLGLLLDRKPSTIRQQLVRLRSSLKSCITKTLETTP